MILAAYLPLTLCDYPGKVSAILFTQGCNFCCPWCHNAHLIPQIGSSPPLDPEPILAELTHRRKRGLLEAVTLSGGEPTIHPDLPVFIQKCKQAGLAVKLDTNGSNPAMLETCFQQRLLDFVAMDIKAPWDRYPTLTATDVDIHAIQTSLQLIASSGVPHQFRTTRVLPDLSETDCATITSQIPPKSPHVWQTYRPV